MDGTDKAVQWAIEQEIEVAPNEFVPVSSDPRTFLVDKVREYFNNNNVDYETFSYKDIEPYLN